MLIQRWAFQIVHRFGVFSNAELHSEDLHHADCRGFGIDQQPTSWTTTAPCICCMLSLFKFTYYQLNILCRYRLRESHKETSSSSPLGPLSLLKYLYLKQQTALIFIRWIWHWSFTWQQARFCLIITPYKHLDTFVCFPTQTLIEDTITHLLGLIDLICKKVIIKYNVTTLVLHINFKWKLFESVFNQTAEGVSHLFEWVAGDRHPNSPNHFLITESHFLFQ